MAVPCSSIVDGKYYEVHYDDDPKTHHVAKVLTSNCKGLRFVIADVFKPVASGGNVKLKLSAKKALLEPKAVICLWNGPTGKA